MVAARYSRHRKTGAVCCVDVEETLLSTTFSSRKEARLTRRGYTQAVSFWV